MDFLDYSLCVVIKRKKYLRHCSLRAVLSYLKVLYHNIPSLDSTSFFLFIVSP